MPDSMFDRFGLFAKREVVLLFFLFAKMTNTVIDGVIINNSEFWAFGILTMLVYLIIVWFTYQRQVISTWALSIIMLYEASGPFINALKALTATPMDNTIMNVLTLTTASYVLFGAFVIFQSRHQCK